MPVCVFDLDNTLTTCPRAHAAHAIQLCRDKGFDVAVNTARPKPWLESHMLDLGLPPPHSLAFMHNPHSYEQTENERAAFKCDAMHAIARHFGSRDLVLFDDLPANIRAVRRAGYHGQLVGAYGAPGITPDDMAVLDHVLATAHSSPPSPAGGPAS